MSGTNTATSWYSVGDAEGVRDGVRDGLREGLEVVGERVGTVGDFDGNDVLGALEGA